MNYPPKKIPNKFIWEKLRKFLQYFRFHWSNLIENLFPGSQNVHTVFSVTWWCFCMQMHKDAEKCTHKPWTMQKKGILDFPYCWNMMHGHDDDDLLCRLQLTRRLVPTLGRPRRPGNNLHFYIFQSISFLVCFYPSAPFLCQFKDSIEIYLCLQC